MKRYFTLFILLISGVVTFAQKDTTRSFSLQQAIDYAGENNPNLKSSRASIESADAKVRETLSSGLPQLAATADLGDNFIIPTSFLPAEVLGGKPGEYVGVKFGTQYVGRATINLDQMIFNGSYFVGLKASKTYTELSRKDLISTQTDVVAAIKKAYYGVLVSRERLALVEKNYHRLDTLLAQTKVMYDNGFSEKIDVSRIEVQYNNIVTTRRTSIVGLEVSMNLLKFQMGIPVAETIYLTDSLETIKLDVLNTDFKSNFNYNDRIEYSKLQVNKQLTELDIKNTKVGYLPRLDFYGNYGASYGTSAYSSFIAFGANWRTLGVFGIRATVPIFDGLKKSNQIQQKRVDLQKLENAQELTKNQIDMEQYQFNQTFLNQVEIVKSQRRNMELAEEVYTVTVIKYQQGVGSNIEVLNADASFKEAQTNYYSALYDALISSVDLEKSYGKLLTKQ